jgi:hypothetical protein
MELSSVCTKNKTDPVREEAGSAVQKDAFHFDSIFRLEIPRCQGGFLKKAGEKMRA